MKKLAISILLCLFILQLHAQYSISPSTQVAEPVGALANIGPGDTLWVDAGLRNELIIRDIHGTTTEPIIIINKGGQVLVETEINYGISISDCSFVKLSGTGSSAVQFGFHIQQVRAQNSVGLTIGHLSSDVEIENIWVGNTGFAGIIAKTEPECDNPETYRDAFTQFNTSIHDCYVHDTGGEGLYIGSSFYRGQVVGNCSVLPPLLEGVEIYNNVIDRSGWDGIQVGSAVQDCNIHDNLVRDFGIAQQSGQMSGINIGGGTLANCYNNKIEDGFGTGIEVLGDGGTRVFNNVIIRSGIKYLPQDDQARQHGIFIADKTENSLDPIGIYSNTIIEPKTDCIRIDGNIKSTIKVFNNALINPGAFDKYENDNTDRHGSDAYIYVLDETATYILVSGNSLRRSMLNLGFVDPESGNYRLEENSPLVDAGRDLNDVDVMFDKDYVYRPQGYGFDIGAFEYVNSSGVDLMTSLPAFQIESLSGQPDGSVNMVFYAPSDGLFSVELFDTTGRKLEGFFSKQMSPGYNEFQFRPPTTGLILLRLSCLGKSISKKLYLVDHE